MFFYPVEILALMFFFSKTINMFQKKKVKYFLVNHDFTLYFQGKCIRK